MTIEELAAEAHQIIIGATPDADNEELHTREDHLMIDALTLIKDTSPDAYARDIARIGLSTKPAPFKRWYS